MNKQDSAVKTLEALGYTYSGGELWKPPIGKAPDFNLMDKLHARIKELESDKHIWSIRNEARFFMIGHIVDDLDRENDIQKIKDYLHWQLNYYQEKVNNNE